MFYQIKRMIVTEGSSQTVVERFQGEGKIREATRL